MIATPYSSIPTSKYLQVNLIRLSLQITPLVGGSITGGGAQGADPLPQNLFSSASWPHNLHNNVWLLSSEGRSCRTLQSHPVQTGSDSPVFWVWSCLLPLVNSIHLSLWFLHPAVWSPRRAPALHTRRDSQSHEHLLCGIIKKCAGRSACDRLHLHRVSSFKLIKTQQPHRHITANPALFLSSPHYSHPLSHTHTPDWSIMWNWKSLQ